MTTTTKGGKVLIVVVNYNGHDYTDECLASLLQIDRPEARVALVDNGSTDGSGERLRQKYGDRIVYLPLPVNLGVTGGNNAGIDHALRHGFDYVMFLNNDTVVVPDFLGRMIEASRREGGALVVPKIICFFDQTRLDHFIGTEFNWLTGQPLDYRPYPLDRPELNRRTKIRVASTCCLLVPAGLFGRIGRMDEKYFMYYDDSDFTIQAARAGCEIVYEPAAVIYHKCNMTTRNQQPSFFEYYLQNRNVFYFYGKLCPDRIKKWRLLSKKVVQMLKDYLKSYIKRQPRQRQVIRLIVRDLLRKRMGPPPALKK